MKYVFEFILLIFPLYIFPIYNVLFYDTHVPIQKAKG